MLTIDEEFWLEGRKVLCPRCDHYRDHVEGKSACFRGEKSGWMQAECRFFLRKDLIPDYKDVAEFEARAQKHLMYEYEKVVQCAEVSGSFCPNRDTMLMFARFSVEEEMPI